MRVDELEGKGSGLGLGILIISFMGFRVLFR